MLQAYAAGRHCNADGFKRLDFVFGFALSTGDYCPGMAPSR